MAEQDDLIADYQLLRAEHSALNAEHKRLEAAAFDLAAHQAHGQQLQAHIERLHRFALARGYTRRAPLMSSPITPLRVVD